VRKEIETNQVVAERSAVLSGVRTQQRRLELAGQDAGGDEARRAALVEAALTIRPEQQQEDVLDLLSSQSTINSSSIPYEDSLVPPLEKPRERALAALK